MGINYDSVETLKDFAEGKSIKFRLLSDEGSHTIRAYGIEDRDGYPHPGTYVVDQEGIVRAALFLEGYRNRHRNKAIIKAANRIGGREGG